MDILGLIKQIAPYLKTKNYTQKGRLFYVIQNNIAYCIEFERPAQQVYLAYYVLPLYIPFETRCFTYGRRMPFGISADNAEMLCKELYKCFDKIVFPFFKKASSPEKLINLCKTNIGRNRFDCTKVDKMRLLYLTYAFLGGEDKTGNLKKRYCQAITEAKYYTDSVKEKLLDEVKMMDGVFDMDPKSVITCYDQVIHQTFRKCFGE